MHLCIELCLSGQPAILLDRNFNVGHYTQTVETFFFFILPLPCLLAPFTSTILCHFHCPCTYLGVTRSAKSKTIGFIFSYIFQLIRMACDVVMKQFKRNILRLLLSKIC